MKDRLIAFSKEPFIAGSFWLTTGTFLANIGNYFFNLLMGRLLTPSDYGTLISLIYFSFIVSLPSAMIRTIATKFAAHFKAKNEALKIAKLIKKFTQYSFMAGIIILILFVLIHPILQDFLNIAESKLIILAGAVVALGLFSSVNGGVLQGFLYFRFFAFLGILAVAIKLLLGWIFVKQGLMVFGALLAIFLSGILAWLISFWPIRSYFFMSSGNTVGLRKKILNFSFPTFAQTAATTFFLSSDLILVKHYFTGTEAGLYAAASTIGKAIYYALMPISGVQFPIVAQRFAQGKKWTRELLLGLILIIVPGILALLVFLFKPDFIVTLFFPSKEYQTIVEIVGMYGIYMLLLAITMLLIQFYLAIEKTLLMYIALLTTLLQAGMISIFHSTLKQVILVSIISVGLLLVMCVVYLVRLLRQRR